MGQSGLTIGLAVYEDLGLLAGRLFSEEQTDEARRREAVATSVLFGEEWDISLTDLEASQRSGWKTFASLNILSSV